MNKKYIFIPTILTLSLFLITPAFANNIIEHNQTIQNTIPLTTQTLTFSPQDLIYETMDFYDLISLANAEMFSEPGQPMLPMKTIHIALPYATTATDLTIHTQTTQTIPGSYTIFPGQPPQPLQQTLTLQTPPNPLIYSQTTPYPEQTIGLIHQADLAGQTYATLIVYPLHYIPTTKTLQLTTQLTFTIHGTNTYEYGDYLPNTISSEGYNTYKTMLQDLVINPEDITLHTNPHPTPSLFLPPGGPYHFVIIGDNSHEPYWQNLLDWRTKTGKKAIYMTTSDIYSNYTGSDNQAKIRAFVIDAHSTWGTLYFLIVGEDNHVPFEDRNYEGTNIPSDQYYGDYDDDWDYEVYVGRVTAASSTEASTFINKVLNYEQNPPMTNYILDATLLGMDLTNWPDPLTAGEDLKDMIDGYIPSGFTVTKVYDSQASNHRTDFINALNDGQNLVNHCDHSNSNVMGTGDINHGWAIYNSDVDALTNTDKPCIIFSLGCYANEMDYNDCIAEHFVIYNPSQAGVAFTGNTRSGWFYVGDPDSLSGELDKDWWYGLFNQNKYVLGETLAYTKNINPSSSDIWKFCQWTLNLLGDPAMPIWTDNPDSFDVIHPATLPLGTSSFLVHVEDDGGQNIDSAQVCLWKDNDVFLTGATNSNGDVTFSPTPTTIGTMYVTVTKQNFLPYTSDATVTGGNQPPYVPSNPNPYDGETNVDINTDLSWTGGDPDGDPVTYDVYFGTATNPPKVSSNQSATTYNLGTLNYETTYHWKIVAWDNQGAHTNGPIWSFTTEQQPNNPPYMPSNPNPSNGQTNVDINTDLSWTGGDPDGDPVTYDVYFGTTTPPTKVSSNQTATTYNPGTIAYETTYYWRIVAWDNHNAHTNGPLWSFTTEEGPQNEPPAPPTITGPTEGTVGEELTFTINIAQDPENDDVFLLIDWDDDTTSEWIGPYNSGETIQITYIFNDARTYNIRAKAKDIYSQESIWSEPHTITITEPATTHSAFLIGTVGTVTETTDYLEIPANKLLYVGLEPLNIVFFQSGETFLAEKDYLGILTDGSPAFIFGIFEVIFLGT